MVHMGKAQSSKKTEKAADMPESGIIHWYPVTEDVTLNASEVKEIEKQLTNIEGLLTMLTYNDTSSINAQVDVAIYETVGQIWQVIRKANR